MSFRKVFILSVVSVLITLNSCKTTDPSASVNVAPVPAAFEAGRQDSTQSIAAIKWSEFFDDPYLISLIDTALKRNLDLQMALQRIDIARAQVRIARGALLPSVSAVTTAGQRKFGAYTMDGVGNFDTNFSNNITPDKRIPEHLPDYYLGLQSSWEIDIWGKLRNQKRATLARFLATEKGKHLVITSLVAEVARYYYELLTLDNSLQILRENIKLQETAVELINAQKSAGRATQLAVNQFVAQLLNTKGLEKQLVQEVIQNENQLNVLLGRYPQHIERGEPILKQTLPTEINAGIPSQMLLNRPDIKQAELELMASKADVGSARAAFFPSLTLTSAVGLQSFTTKNLFDTPGSVAYSVFGGLTAPLFNRNMISSEYRQAKSQNIAMLLNYNKTIVTAFSEVVTNMSRISNYRDVSNLKEGEVKELQAGVAVSQELFVAGMASYLEVITAQKSVLEAELDLSHARKEQFYSVIDLYRAVGGGWQ